MDMNFLPDSPASRALRWSLHGDAIALGPHWIYEPEDIARRFGKITEPTDPPSDLYHAGKKKGDQTHYGDQTLCLLHSIRDNGGKFDPAHFAVRWRAMWDGYGDYFDKATKQTLAALDEGVPWEKAGSDSTELGGAARLGALLTSDAVENEESLVAASRAQTGITHRSEISLATAEFLARAVYRRLHGMPLGEALDSATANSQGADFAGWLAQAGNLAESGASGAEIVAQTGASCGIPQALPATMALALRHGKGTPLAALCENAAAGGDSAARGLVLGLLLGTDSAFA